MREERGTDRAQPNGNLGNERTPLPRPRDLLAAIGLLTILPLPRPERRSEAFGRATLFLPVVGLLLGCILTGVNWTLASRLRPWLSGILVVAAWEALTAHTGARAAAQVITAIIKIVGLAAAPGARPAALLFAPLLARWCAVVLATGARDAAAPGRKFNAAITFREFALTSVFTLAVVFTVADAFGILLVVCVGALALGLRLFFHRYAGGVSWPALVTTIQGIEAVVVVLCTVL